MSRPRLDPEQKKVSFSLAFSPQLIAALERVRGAKSQSVFVEEWLRQHPQIAAELVAMNAPGFTPPVVRYEHLMDRLLAFYLPPKPSDLRNTLLIAQKAILLGRGKTDEHITAQIEGAMAAFWEQERRRHGHDTARGESLPAILPSLKEYARYYYQAVFLDMAQGDRQRLQHRFRSIVRGCEAVYHERQKRDTEHQIG